MPNQDHPIWFIGKALIILAFATLFAYNNANSFDETELKNAGAISNSTIRWSRNRIPSSQKRQTRNEF